MNVVKAIGIVLGLVSMVLLSAAATVLPILLVIAGLKYILA